MTSSRNNRVRHDVMTGVVDALPVAVVEIDPELRVRFLNRPFRQWFVGARRKLVGLPLAQVAAPFADAFGRAIESAFAGASAVEEARLPADDGRRREIRATCAPRREDGGEVVGVVVTAVDVTEEKRRLASERILAQATEDLFATLEPEVALQTIADNAVASLADWISIELVREDGGLEQVALAHRDPDRLLVAGQIRRSHPPHDALRRVVKRGTAELTDQIGEQELRARSQGDAVHLELLRRMDIGASLVVPLAAHDAVFGAIALVRSRSSGRTFSPAELALVEELARRAALAIENARLFDLTRRAVVAREQLLAIVCHDLRDPLGVIRARSAVLKQRIDALGDPAGLNVEAIERATDRMDALVSALTDAARLRAGRLAIHPQPCDLVELARTAAAGVSGLAADKEIRLSLAAGAERAMAMVDPEHIAQVLASLLDNAVKFTPRGGQIELRVSPVASEVHIAVVDSGAGIPRDELSRIFERAWQVEPGQERAPGLGLTIARGIVEAHRGRIWAESQVGHGTAVRIALPTA